MKMQLRDPQFNTVVKIQRESRKVLDSFTENNFQTGFQRWQHACNLCIAEQGNYFDRNNIKT